MDHTCHQCGQEIEAGTPFCRHCGAPQIRVAIPEQAETAPAPPAEPEHVQVASSVPAAPVVAGRPATIDWSQAFPSALWAGVVLAAAWIVPYIGYFLWIIAAGILAVGLYRRRMPDASLTPSNGARLGAVCGLFGFAGFAGLMAIGLLMMRGSSKFRELLQQTMQQAAANNPDPRAQEMLSQLMTPAGMAVMVTIVLVVFLIGFVLLGSAGGAIGAWIFQARGKSSR
jgi:hypothetical protein